MLEVINYYFFLNLLKINSLYNKSNPNGRFCDTNHDCNVLIPNLFMTFSYYDFVCACVHFNILRPGVFAAVQCSDIVFPSIQNIT